MAHKVLNLDLSKEPRGNPIVYGRVGDSDSQMVTVNVTKKLSKQDLSDYTISFEGETSGGKAKVIDSENVISTPEGLKQGTFDYLFPSKAFAVAGEYKRAYFSFVNGNSRDTTGDFKFVVLQNADLTAEEAETVIFEYNKLVEELQKQQDLAIDEMDQNFAAVQERIIELENQIGELQSRINQILTDFENGNFWTKEESFNKEQTSTNVIYQLIGKEKVRLTFILDAKNKIAGSDTENPNCITRAVRTAKPIPPTGAELTNGTGWDAYEKVSTLDGTVLELATGNDYPFMLFDYDVLEVVKRELGENFFTSQGATSQIEQVDILRRVTNTVTTNSTIWGHGSSVNGNRIYHQLFNRFNSQWQYSQSNTASGITPLNIPVPAGNMQAHIMDDGHVHGMTYTDEAADGTMAKIRIDYARLDFSIEISAYEYFTSVIAAYHRPFEAQLNDLAGRISALENK